MAEPGFLFFGNPNSGLTYDELKRRRQIATALASRGSKFPKTLGEGLTYLGESAGEMMQNYQLARAEEEQRQYEGKEMAPLTPQPDKTAENDTTPSPVRTADATTPPDTSVTNTTPPPPLPVSRNEIAQSVDPKDTQSLFKMTPETAQPPGVQTASLDPTSGVDAARNAVTQAAVGQPAPPPGVATAPPSTGVVAPSPVQVAQAGGAKKQPYETPTEILTQTPAPSLAPTPRARDAFERMNNPRLSPEARANAAAVYKEEQTDVRDKYNKWWDAEQVRKGRVLGEPARQLEVGTRGEQLSQEQMKTDVQRRQGGISQEILAEPLRKSAETVKGIPAASLALKTARDALDKGIISGSFADTRLQMAKMKELLAPMLGMDGSDPRIATTEQFQAAIAPLWAQARQAQAGGANISDADIDNAKASVAGKISLDPNTFRGVLDTLEKINLFTAIEHQKKIQGLAAGDLQANERLQDSYGLPMETIIPQRWINTLKKFPESAEEFDRKFHSPGLARKILGGQ